MRQAALVLLLLMVATTGACKVFGSGSGSEPDVTGSWRWQLHYSDGTNTQFIMQLTDFDGVKYRAVISRVDEGSVTVNDGKVTWVWQRTDGSLLVASGTYRYNPDGWDGSGVDTFPNGGSDSFDFTVDRY
jgi:hypothetical protein